MTLPTKTWDQFVSDLTSSWAQNTNTTPSLSTGDGLLAIFQSLASQLQFLQALAQICIQVSRAQTSTGSDLDSFYAQFDFTRLPAAQATGQATFGTLLPAANNIYIPVGTVIQNTGGTIQYSVIADATQPNYSAANNGYLLSAGTSSATATVEALDAGTAYNVSAGQLVQLASSVPGVATVTNAYAISNGADAESDDAYRARFVLYLASLAQATESAILAAAENVSQTLSINLLENVNGVGNAQDGTFTAIVSDAGSAPSSSTLIQVYNAIFAARAFSVQPFAISAIYDSLTVSLNIRVASGYTASYVIADVKTAIETYAASLPIGATLYLEKLVGAVGAVSGVVSVQLSSVLVNGLNEDYTPVTTHALQIAGSAITVGTY